MKVSVASQPGQGYRQAITARNHTIYADVPQNLGGSDTAPTPHELLLGALGGCTAITLQMYAQRKNWDLQAVKVDVEEDTVPVPGDPAGKTMPRLTKEISVRGNLDAQQLASLASVAERCPVNQLLKNEKQTVSHLNLVV